MAVLAALRRLALVACLATGAAHAQGAGTAAAPSEPQLQRGRTVWAGTCGDCHANPLSDAPQVKDRAAWSARIGRGRDALLASALNGRVGPGGAEMPARGGNRALSDADVAAAVDYLLYLVTETSRKETQ